MTEEQLKELGGVIAALPARPQSYSYEGQVRPARCAYKEVQEAARKAFSGGV